MLVMTPNTQPTPEEHLLAMESIWKFSQPERFSLFLLGGGGMPVSLGVACPDARTESDMAVMIRDVCGSDEPSVYNYEQRIRNQDEVCSRVFTYRDRHLPVETGAGAFGWQRVDPLAATYRVLADIPRDVIAGLGLTLRALPDMRFECSATCFAAGPDAAEHIDRIKASLTGTGLIPHKPFMQRRAALKALECRFRRPFHIWPVNTVSRFWHPPFSKGTSSTRRAS